MLRNCCAAAHKSGFMLLGKMNLQKLKELLCFLLHLCVWVSILYIDMCIYPGTTATVTYSCRKSAMMHPVKNALKEQYSGSTQRLFRHEARKMALLSERCFLRRKMRGKVLVIFPAKLIYFFLTGNDLISGSII